MYLAGVKEKYPTELLKNRLTIEGNVIGIIYKDILMLDEISLTSAEFITKDGLFYFKLAKSLRDKKLNCIDEVSILTYCSDNVIARFNELGGIESINHLCDIVNLANAEAYLDRLHKANIILKLHSDSFDVLKTIEYKDKQIRAIDLFDNMSSEEVLDWYDSRLCILNTGYSNKVLEEGEISFDEDEDILNEDEEIGVPFEVAGIDVEGQDINCLPFLSKQIAGITTGSLNALAGHSSTGKSTLMITIIMGLLFSDRKFLIISNEENLKRFKSKFLMWWIYKYHRNFTIDRKKIKAKALTDEEKEVVKSAIKSFNKEFKGRLFFVAISDSDTSLVKKCVRKYVLEYGVDSVLYDTMKVDIDTGKDNTWLSLVKDTRDFFSLARKYNLIFFVTIQLAMNSKGKLFLDGSELSNSKQMIETFENFFCLRNVYEEEIDPENKKFYCHPFRHVKKDGKWVAEKYELERGKTYKMLFVAKAREGENSESSGTAYILNFIGTKCIFQEKCKCYPKHGNIN